MQGILAYKYGKGVSEFIGNLHEHEGDWTSQPKNERNMDLWNNRIGRGIAEELKKELKQQGRFKNISQTDFEDMLAERINKKLRNGELITHPSDKRKFSPAKNPILGLAASIDNFDGGGIPSFKDIIGGFEGSSNPADLGRIYTREDVGAMNTSEFAAHKPFIDNQFAKIGLPASSELKGISGFSDAGDSTGDGFGSLNGGFGGGI